MPVIITSRLVFVLGCLPMWGTESESGSKNAWVTHSTIEENVKKRVALEFPISYIVFR